MIQWSWRIEGKRRIWCGSWSDEDRWARVFKKLLHTKAVAVSLFGRLPEIDPCLSKGLHVVSMMTAEGDPQWALLDRHANLTKSIGVKLDGYILRWGIAVQLIPPLHSSHTQCRLR